jgi:single-strand DNA-binding protein
MPSYNRVVLVGNLTRDPELRYTPNNQAVCNFGIAINRHWTDHAGAKQEEVTYVDCEAWARTAEVVNQYTRKGSPILVEGRLKLDQWQDKGGEKRSKLKVVADSIQLLGGGNGVGDGASEADPKPGPGPKPKENYGWEQPSGDARSRPQYQPQRGMPEENFAF